MLCWDLVLYVIKILKYFKQGCDIKRHILKEFLLNMENWLSGLRLEKIICVQDVDEVLGEKMAKGRAQGKNRKKKYL